MNVILGFLWKLIGFIVALTLFLAALVTVFPSLHNVKALELDSYFSVEDKMLVVKIILTILLIGIIFGVCKLCLYLFAKRKKQLVISLPIYREKVPTNHNTENQLFGATQSGRRPIFISEPLQDITVAKKIAQQDNKLVFAVIYDENHPKKSQLLYSLGCFMDYMTTKQLVEKNFISVLASSSNKDAAALIPTDNPLENCFWVVFNSVGKVVHTEEVYANASEGLKRVKDVIAKYTSLPNSNRKLPKDQLFGATQSGRRPIFISEPLQDITAAKEIAQQDNKLVFAVIYDENHPKKSQLLYSLGCFMDYMTTKQLVEKNFISVLASSSNKDAAALIPTDNPLENCFWVVFNSVGKVVHTEEVYANASEGLKTSQGCNSKIFMIGTGLATGN